MSLLDVRIQFRSVSGRYDLVNDDDSDNGADAYINAGIRHLDRRSNFQKSPARVFSLNAAGTYLVQFQKARAIKEVWVATPTERWQLEKMQWQDFRATYVNPWASLTTGSPKYYSPTFLRPSPEALTAGELTALDWVTNYMDVVTDGTHYLYNAVLIGPPSDVEMMVEVVGLFYSTTLSDDDDTNMWTEAFPELVVQAACLELEKMHRNTQGVNDWANALAVSLDEIEKDSVEEEAAEAVEMKG